VSWREFIASLVDSLAWPLSAAFAVYLLRQQLAALLEAPMKRWKAGPVEVEYWEKEAALVAGSVAALEPPSAQPAEPDGELSHLVELADKSPGAAIVSGFALIEREVRGIAQAGELESADKMPLGRLVPLAAERGLINAETVSAVQGLVVLRNLAAHGPAREGEPSAQRAREYVALVQAVLYALRQARAKLPPRPPGDRPRGAD
jgi:hypothetical protein